ncbi:hypothetical protein AVEN_98585-1, partial [Araneus ventricosus]
FKMDDSTMWIVMIRKFKSPIHMEHYLPHKRVFPDLKSALASVKLDIHRRSAPIHLQGFLADRFHSQFIKFGG